MPLAAGLGQGTPGIGQENRPVRARFNKTLTLQTLKDGIDRRTGHTKSGSQINRSRFAGLFNQLGDHFNIIFGNFGLMRPPDTVKFGSAIIYFWACHKQPFLLSVLAA
jgi:hypothetical protein